MEDVTLHNPKKLHKRVLNAVYQFIPQQNPSPSTTESGDQKSFVRCVLCQRQLDRKCHATRCDMCSNFACKEHHVSKKKLHQM